MGKLVHLPARRGIARAMDKGGTVRVVNTHGQQVVDTWAFSRDVIREFMSMEHSRVHMGRVQPITGSTLLSNRRNPMLTIVEDTSGGVHDTLMAACDGYRYRMLGCSGHHDNCTENLHAALAQINLQAPETPAPLNLFQNSAVGSDGSLTIAAPIAPPGSFVTLQAAMDLVIVFSACPQDMVPTNGADMTPRDVDLVFS
ncbi:MAG: urea carboxylase-associated family protein [Hyphomicrobiales bacterium]